MVKVCDQEPGVFADGVAFGVVEVAVLKGLAGAINQDVQRRSKRDLLLR